MRRITRKKDQLKDLICNARRENNFKDVWIDKKILQTKNQNSLLYIKKSNSLEMEQWKSA